MIDFRAATRGRLDDVWDAGLDVLDELFADDHVYHDPVMADLPTGPDGVHAVIDALLTAMPDGTLRVDEWIEDPDTVIARWTFAGTHTGTLFDMAPSGRSATTSGVHVFRFRGDRIAETWASYDVLGVLRQLGLVTLDIALDGACDQT